MVLTGCFLLLLLCIGQVACSIIAMNSVCQIKLDVLLDCTQVETDDGTECVFQTTLPANDVTRIQFFRLMGTLILENLPNINTVEVMVGRAECNQIITKKAVTLMLSDSTLLCVPNYKHISTTSSLLSSVEQSKDERKSQSLRTSTELELPSTSSIVQSKDEEKKHSTTTHTDLKLPSTNPSITTLPTSYEHTDGMDSFIIVISTVPGIIIIFIIMIVIYKRCRECRRRCSKRCCRRNSSDVEMVGVHSFHLPEISEESSEIIFAKPLTAVKPVIKID